MDSLLEEEQAVHEAEWAQLAQDRARVQKRGKEISRLLATAQKDPSRVSLDQVHDLLNSSSTSWGLPGQGPLLRYAPDGPEGPVSWPQNSTLLRL